MPSERDALRRVLNDIAHNIRLAQRFTVDLDEAGFIADVRTVYAVTRCLEIVSEASRRLPDGLKARHPSIAWKEMAAAGNVYRHDYEDVAPDFIWVTLRDHLPQLLAAVSAELDTLVSSPDNEV